MFLLPRLSRTHHCRRTTCSRASWQRAPRAHPLPVSPLSAAAACRVLTGLAALMTMPICILHEAPKRLLAAALRARRARTCLRALLPFTEPIAVLRLRCEFDGPIRCQPLLPAAATRRVLTGLAALVTMPIRILSEAPQRLLSAALRTRPFRTCVTLSCCLCFRARITPAGPPVIMSLS